MNIIKRIRLEICWRRGHRLYFGNNPSCGTCADKKAAKKKPVSMKS
jgi:hypothetical protein